MSWPNPTPPAPPPTPRNAWNGWGSMVPSNHGTVPQRTACVANSNGYGPHETTALHPTMNLGDGSGNPSISYYPCKHCGSLYGVSS